MAKYRFEDIAFNSTAKKKPVEEDRHTYLGLEHLDGENLQVTRFGAEVAPKGDKLLMKKGDVLFGKRRAYQKKVAIAPFDGIFSAHGMVLRPKEDVINKDFFPFFISSDYFLDAAIKISVGSLSPTINWRDLKELEFDLPDIEEQERLAKILWAAEDLKRKYNVCINDCVDVKQTLIDEIISCDDVKMTPLGELCIKSPQYGSTASKIDYNGLNRYIRITDIDLDGRLIESQIASPSKYDDKYLLSKGDILFARSGTVGLTYLHNDDQNCIYAGYLIRYKLNVEKILPEYLFQVTKSRYYIQWVENIKRTGTISNINAQEFSSFLVPLVNITTQESLLKKCDISNRTINMLRDNLNEINLIQKKMLTNQKEA